MFATSKTETVNGYARTGHIFNIRVNDKFKCQRCDLAWAGVQCFCDGARAKAPTRAAAAAGANPEPVATSEPQLSKYIGHGSKSTALATIGIEPCMINDENEVYSGNSQIGKATVALTTWQAKSVTAMNNPTRMRLGHRFLKRTAERLGVDVAADVGLAALLNVVLAEEGTYLTRNTLRELHPETSKVGAFLNLDATSFGIGKAFDQ